MGERVWTNDNVSDETGRSVAVEIPQTALHPNKKEDKK